jgi:hypothetical protein
MLPQSTEIHLKCRICYSCAPQKINVSSAKSKCFTTIASDSLGPTAKPGIEPCSNTATSIRLKASITTTNNKGDRRSPCRNPQELVKKPDGIPLTGMENLTVEIQKESKPSISPQSHIVAVSKARNPNSHDHKPFPNPTYTATKIPPNEFDYPHIHWQ